jgi:LPXTG-site transpeptidase (sortase) family protein
LLALCLRALTSDRRRAVAGSFLVTGIVLLGLYVSVAIESKAFNIYQDYRLGRRALELAREGGASALGRARLAEGELIGRLEIERLGVRAAVVEGTPSALLRKALGHVESTALPGESGNVAIAGHRDTFFRNLDEVRPGDRIALVTPEARYEYVVDQTRITDPHDLSALEHDGHDSARLTLITCYPFYWIGPAPRRFIVQARAAAAAEHPPPAPAPVLSASDESGASRAEAREVERAARRDHATDGAGRTLEARSKRELRKRAAALGIPGYKRMNKAELIRAIRLNPGPSP